MRYAKIDRRIWSDEKFATLSGPAKLLAFYLLTTPYANLLPGVIRMSEEAVAADLNWPLERYKERFAELYRIGFAKHDAQYHHFFLPNSIKYNFPCNLNVIKSWRNSYFELSSCALKSEIRRTLKHAIKSLKPEWVSTFETVCPTISIPFANGMPIQEQDIEQEQEQYREPSSPTPPSEVKVSALWLCDQLSAAGKDMRLLFAEVIEQERRNGTDEVQLIAENMLRSRRNYEALSDHAGFFWPVKAFFAQGVWKRPNEWRNDHAPSTQNHRRDFQRILERAADRDLEQLDVHHAERGPHH